MCEECDDNQTGQGSERIILVDVILIGCRLAGNILGTTGQAVHAFGNLIGSHSTWVRDREHFANSAGYDIEMITADPDNSP